MTENITFIDINGNKETINIINLAKYPTSYMTLQAKRIFYNDINENCHKVPFYGKTLSIISNFYRTGTWLNPFIRENRLEIDNILGDFYIVCDYLGLPSSEIIINDDINDEHDDNHIYDLYIDEIELLERKYYDYLEEEHELYCLYKSEELKCKMDDIY